MTTQLPYLNMLATLLQNPSGYFFYLQKWAPSSEFESSSIPSWQISTAHAQPFRGARDLAFCLKFPLDSLLVIASSEGSGETARMRRLAWTFAVRIGFKYQIRLTRSKYCTNLAITFLSIQIFYLFISEQCNMSCHGKACTCWLSHLKLNCKIFSSLKAIDLLLEMDSIHIVWEKYRNLSSFRSKCCHLGNDTHLDTQHHQLV